MELRDTIQVIFPEPGASVALLDVGEFLSRFSQIYEICVYVTRSRSPEEALVSLESLRASVERVLNGEERIAHEDKNLDSGEVLTCTKLSYGSPFEIVTVGIPTALALAVIICGGEVKLFSGEFRLNKSLGEALHDIKRLFQPTRLKPAKNSRPVKAARPAESAESAKSVESSISEPFADALQPARKKATRRRAVTGRGRTRN